MRISVSIDRDSHSEPVEIKTGENVLKLVVVGVKDPRIALETKDGYRVLLPTWATKLELGQ